MNAEDAVGTIIKQNRSHWFDVPCEEDRRNGAWKKLLERMAGNREQIYQKRREAKIFVKGRNRITDQNWLAWKFKKQ